MDSTRWRSSTSPATSPPHCAGWVGSSASSAPPCRCSSGSACWAPYPPRTSMPPRPRSGYSARAPGDTRWCSPSVGTPERPVATLTRVPLSAGETQPPRPSWLNHPLIRVALFATLVIGLWWLLAKIDLARTGAILRQARPLPIVLACLANLLSQVTRAVGWAVLLAEYRIPFSRLVRYELT